MKSKMIVKICADFCMTVLLLLLMARQLTGDTAHEWLGAGMFVLWIAHHLLNFQWHVHLFHGKYTPFRILQLVVNFLLLVSMVGTMASGIILSRNVFALLPISGGLAFARLLHILCSFWGFILMALHLGLHWTMILGMLRKVTGPISAKSLRITLRAGGVAIAGYGLYAFWKNQFLSYMFLTTHFVFFDFDRPSFLFFAEYIAILGCFVWFGYYGRMAIQKLAKKKAALKHEK